MQIEKTAKEVTNYSMSMLYKRKLNVAAYIRVSTLTEEQKLSFEQQRKYYTKKICENKNWNLINIYGDDGISGTKVFLRFGFQELVKDVVRGKIDLILTKSISRFARNTLDILNYIRMFKKYNCAVYFEEESINTLEMRGELLLTILSSIAQQEAENLSSHVKMGLEMKMRRGELVGFNSCYGYDYDVENKMIYINPIEADVVKQIFKMYLNNCSAQYIANYLTKNKIKTKRNLDRWNDGTIYGILKNEKYTGDLLQGKYYICSNDKSKMKKNTGQKDMYYIKNHHEAIIDRETWDKVQKKFESHKKYNVKNKTVSYANYFICGFCNSKLNRFKGYKKFDYICSSKSNLKCSNARYIPEQLFFSLFIETMNRLNDYLHNRIINENDYDLIYIRKVVSKYLLDKKITLFNIDFFKEIIRCFIIGEKDDPYKIRIVLNTEMIFNEFKKKNIVDVNNNYFLILFNFNYNFEISSYVKDSNGKKKLEKIKKLKVSVEVLDEDKNGNKCY